MKKAKTLILSLVIMLASAFISACSCSAENVTQIYEKSISIECLTNDVTHSLDPESGLLTIDCHRGAVFTIQYTLTPANATTTQVSWSFDTSGVVVPQQPVYTYSKTVQESVTFVANREGTTNLTFKTNNTGKTAVAKITVAPPVSQLNTFVAPSGIKYNNATGMVSWVGVKKIELPNGKVEDIKDGDFVNGVAKGLQSYKVDVVDLSSGSTSSFTVNADITEFGGYEKFEIGKPYKINVTAIANSMQAVSSEKSDPFSFCQLPSVTSEEIFNDGDIKFKLPENSSSYEIFDAKNNQAKVVDCSNAANVSINYGDVFTEANATNGYDIRIRALPTNYDASKDYGMISGIQYYPSAMTTTKSVIKLETPNASLANIYYGAGESVTIKSNTLIAEENELVKESVISMTLKNDYSKYAPTIKYNYEIYKLNTDGTRFSDITHEGFGNFNTKGIATINLNDATSKGLSEGYYEIDIHYTSDYVTSTINGDKQTIKFYQLGKVDKNKNAISIAEDYIKVVSNATINGVELYFIDANNNSQNTKRLFVSSTGKEIKYNIANLNLTPGDYVVYAKLIGKQEGLTNTATCNLDTWSTSMNIKVLSSLSNVNIQSEGLITFTKPNLSNSYLSYTLDVALNTSRGLVNFSVGFSTSDNDVSIDSQDSSKISVNLYDLIDKYYGLMLANGDITEEDYNNNVPSKEKLDIPNGSFIELTAHCKEIDAVSYISSASQNTKVNISRLACPSITGIDSQKGEFKYSNISNASSYVITVNNTYKFISDNGILSTGAKDENEEKTLLEVLLKDKKNLFSIYAEGSNGIPGDNTPAYMDSKIGSTYYAPNVAPIVTIQEDDNGRAIVSWVPQMIIESGENTYETIEKSNLNNGESYTLYLTLDGADEPFNTINVGSVLTCDITEYLIGANLGKKVNIKVEENVTRNLINISPVSNVVSAMKLEKVASIEKVVDVETVESDTENVYKLQWNAVENATNYNIFCNNELIESPTIVSKQVEIESKQVTICEYTIDTENWDEGIYRFKIVATLEDSENYIVLDSDSSDVVEVEIIKSDVDIDINIDGTEISWSLENADLLTTDVKFSYELWVASEYGVEGKSAVKSAITSDDKSVDVSDLTADKEYILIVSLDKTDSHYTTDGKIILGDAESELEFSRRSTASGFKTENGTDLVFSLAYSIEELNGTNNSNQPAIICIYMDGETDNAVIEYNMLDENVVYSDASIGESPDIEYITTFKFNVTGLIFDGKSHTFQVKVTQPGFVDSAMSGEEECTITQLVETELLEKSVYSSIHVIKWAKVENASSYIVSIIKINTDGTSDKVEFISCSNPGSTTESNFFIVENYLYYKFTEEEFFKHGSGDYYVSIKACTETEGHIHGNSSDAIVITKLNSDATISVESGYVKITAYEVDSYKGNTPTHIEVIIQSMSVTQVEDTDDQGNPKLDENSNPIMKDVTVPVEGAVVKKDYAYSDNSGDILIDIMSAEYEKLQVDTYSLFTVSVRYYYSNVDENDINEIYILDSATITNDSVSKLSTATINTDNGEIVWTQTNTNTTSYLVSVSYNEIIVDPETNENTSKTVEKEIKEFIPVDLTSPKLTEAEYMTAIGENFSAGVVYIIKVRAQAEGYLSSIWSKEFSFTKMAAPSDIKVNGSDLVSDGESNLTYYKGSPLITWNNTNANYKGSALDIVYSFSDELTSLGLTEVTSVGYELPNDLKEGDKTFKLKFIGSSTTSGEFGYLTSEYSDEVTIVYGLDNTKPTLNANGVLTWNKVGTDATVGYKVTANIKGNEKVFYTVENQIDFSGDNALLSELRENSGNITFTVNAITDPSKFMITKKADLVHENTVTVYKPELVGDLKVLNGDLSWTVGISELSDYINTLPEGSVVIPAGSTSAIDYLYTNINNKSIATATDDIAKQLSFMYSFKLKVNTLEYTVIPTKVEAIDDDGDVYNSPSVEGAKYLRFIYDIQIENAFDETSSDAYLTKPGEFKINISRNGYSDGKVMVLDSSLLADTLDVFKPVTPKSWSDAETFEDMKDGNLRWALVVKDVNITEGQGGAQIVTNVFEYDYTFRVYDDKNILLLTEDYTVNPAEDLVSGSDYLCEKSIYELFFKFVRSETNESGILEFNTSYRVSIYANGTEDSLAPEFTGNIYLKTNTYVFGQTMLFIGNTNPKVKDNYLSWDRNIDGGISEVTIYGPFSNKSVYFDSENNTLIENWRDSINLSEVTPKEILRFNLETEDSLTLFNDTNYGDGAYIITVQEIGNGLGNIDSAIAETTAIKLESVTEQVGNSEWIGKGGNAGKFVWNSVPLATGYVVHVYRFKNNENGEHELLGTYDYTTNAYYELDDLNGLFPTANDNKTTYYKYGIEIIPVVMGDYTGSYSETLFETFVFADGYFAGDSEFTSVYRRTDTPTDIKVYANGMIQWNNNKTYAVNAYYDVRMAYAEYVDKKSTTGNEQKESFVNLSEILDQGTVQVRVRAVAEDYSILASIDDLGLESEEYMLLNSNYSMGITVTKLADPTLRLEKGVFVWSSLDSGEEGVVLTPSELILNNAQTPEVLPQNVTSYPLYTEIDTTNYSGYDPAKEEYNIGEHTFQVKFQGSSTGDKDYVTSSDTNYYVTSDYETLTASKLGLPVISTSAYNGISSIKWTHVSNAVGYKVKAIQLVEGVAKKTYEYVYYPEEGGYSVTIYVDGNYTTKSTNVEAYFVQDDNQRYFKLTDLNNRVKVEDSNGGEYWVYVQALGSTIYKKDVTQNETIYLSSSYSKGIHISMPDAVTNVNFNSVTGRVYWELTNQHKDSQYSIILTAIYEVKEVDNDMFINYWNVSLSEEFSPFEELMTRSVHVTNISGSTGSEKRNITVTDTYLLNGEGATLSEFYLKAMAKYTSISVIVKEYVEKDNFDSLYRSQSSAVNWTSVDGVNLNIYNFGDGSFYNPYQVVNSSSVDHFRNYLNSHFELCNDINVSGLSTILGEFSGSMVGKNIGTQETPLYPTLEITRSGSNLNSDSSENNYIAAVFESIGAKAKVQNVNIKFNYTFTGSWAKPVYIAGLAINNYGEIDNVNIIDSSISYALAATSLKVGGLVVNNYNTISNVSSDVDIVAMDLSSESNLVAGIAVYNGYDGTNINTDASIKNSSFIGSLKGNAVGGIVHSNYAIISYCYSTGELTGINYGYNNAYKVSNVNIAGLAVSAYLDSKIYACYSVSELKVDLVASDSVNVYVGGLVANVYTKESAISNSVNISNCYAVINISKNVNGSATISLNLYYMAPTTNVDSENNYYVVESGPNDWGSSWGTSIGTVCEDLESLKTNLSSLKDNESDIYDTTAETYPIFKSKN